MAKDRSRGWGGVHRATSRWYDVSFTGWRKSRRNRECDACDRRILKGDEYYRHNQSAFCSEECARPPAMSG